MHLARSTRRHILTLRARLPTSNLHIRPSPIRAAPITAQNINRSSIALNGASNPLHGQIGNRNASGGSTGRTAVLVVLLNDNAVVGDARELDVVEGYARNFAGGAGDGLNADAVGRVGDGRVGDCDVADGIVVAAANGADRKTVAAGPGTTGEDDVLDEILDRCIRV